MAKKTPSELTKIRKITKSRKPRQTPSKKEPKEKPDPPTDPFFTETVQSAPAVHNPDIPLLPTRRPGRPRIHPKPPETGIFASVKRLELEQKKKDEAKEVYSAQYLTMRNNCLPHLYGWPWYAWAKTFFDSANHMNLLCAPNQISKSSTQIRKCIDWATDKTKWPRLWPKRAPKIFWYLYPSKEVATVEFEKKWLPEFMPRGRYKDIMPYGWKAEYMTKHIYAIHFMTGVSVYFKTYGQGGQMLQSATADAVFTDEELPEDLYSELAARLFGTDGYFHMVFTATLNQDMWLRAMEATGEQELFPNALKVQVSMYDCQVYADGSPSPWTLERIKEKEASCKNQTEIQRRILGRFVTEVGRRYPTFDGTRHYKKIFPVPESWRVYAGVDHGSGGGTGHPAAIVFVAVNHEGTCGYVIRGWRGDSEQTTSGDVLNKFQMLKGRKPLTLATYDWHAKDFGLIAARNNEPFTRAVKDRMHGEEVINTLFRNDMLFIFDTDELRKLGSELTSLMVTTDKTKAKDDFIDALRYAVTAIPWDWTAIKTKETSSAESEEKASDSRPETEDERKAREIRERRGEEKVSVGREDWGELEKEFEEWNEAYGN